MMAEMIATYSAGPSAAVSAAVDPRKGATPTPAPDAPAGGGYLNEVRSR
jgi:hypothetical protein